MNVLQICLRVPFPPKDGAAIAMNSIAQGIIECGHSLTVLAVNTPKHWINTNEIPANYLEKINFHSVPINTEVNALGALISFITPSHSYNISRFYNKNFENLIIKTLNNQSFEYIIIESLFMASYVKLIKEHTKAKIVLRSHNIEYTIWQTLALNEKNTFKRIYLFHLASRLKKFEIKAGNWFDAIVPISLNDETYYHLHYPNKPLTTIYCGVSDELLKSNYTVSNPNSIYHLGSMDWLPNIEGIDWFINEIWPLIFEKNKNIKCYLAGRKMPDRFLNQKTENLNIESFVEDAINFQKKHNIMIVPLITGGGIRIKILEGLALGKVIITTSKGVEGINAENNKHLIIADNAADFAKSVLKCVGDPDFCSYISKNARDFANENFSNKNLAQKLISFLKNI